MAEPIRILIWNEGRHEQTDAPVQAIYRAGIDGAIADGLRENGLEHVRTARLDDPEQGLSEHALAATDVLIWWGHRAHQEVSDAAVERVYQRVHAGMGLVALHSAHFSKIFCRLMGTSCGLKWREAGERERIWVIEPAHPIAEGLGEGFTLEHEEMYGERFDVPAPETLVLVSWFEGGEVFRSGCCYTRGQGRVFYFRPGHETHPTYHHPQVRRVIANAVRWCAPLLP
ncbi:MAG: trehalose utilization protein ThuA [Thermoanaerobaculia bacterium]|nr:trehalose utilization protein ThuA [Thermoanaerobaculia bacterium]